MPLIDRSGGKSTHIPYSSRSRPTDTCVKERIWEKNRSTDSISLPQQNRKSTGPEM